MIKIDDMPRRILVGRTLDNGYSALQIDCGEWVKRHPQLTEYRIEVKRPDGEMYFADTTFADGVLTWNINAADTAIAGDGEFQVVAIGTDGERKTSSHPIMFVSDIIAGTAAETPPEANKTWMDRVIEETQKSAAQAAASAAEAKETLESIPEDYMELADEVDRISGGIDYVTPQMFGAVGDGATDDTVAFQAAVDSGKPIRLVSSYKISNVKLRSHCKIFGTYSTRIITAANEAAFVYDKTVERCMFDGFAVSGAGVGFKYADKNSFYYLANATFKDLAFFADLHSGVEANIILCEFDNCIFGYYGTPNPNGCSHVVCESEEGTGRQSTDNRFVGCRFYNATEQSIKLQYSLHNYFIGCNFERNKCADKTIYTTGCLAIYFDKCWFELNEGNTVIYADQGNVYSSNSVIVNNCLVMLAEGTTRFAHNYAGFISIDNSTFFCNNVPIVSVATKLSSFSNNKVYNAPDEYEIKLPIERVDVCSHGLIADRWFKDYESGTPDGWVSKNVVLTAGESTYYGVGLHYKTTDLGYNSILTKVGLPGLKGKKVKLIYFADRKSGTVDAFWPVYSLDGSSMSVISGGIPVTYTASRIYEIGFVAPEDVFYVGLRCGGAITEGNIYAIDLMLDGNSLINPVLGAD